MSPAEMTSRQRWLALLNGQRSDRIPADYWATDEVTRRLLRDLGCRGAEELFTRLHVDALAGVGPPARRTSHPEDPQANIWGVRKRAISYGSGTYEEAVNTPLAYVETVEQVHAYRWPVVTECYDFDGFAERLRAAPAHRAIKVGGYEPFLLYCWLRGMELAMMDLLAEPAIAEAILGHIFDFHHELNRRLFEIGAGRIDLTYIAEDLGSQHGLLLSLETIRRFLLPNLTRMADLARGYGIHIFYHTDGACRQAIPDLLDVTGIEILNPIQWRCPGMERDGLVRDFGDRVIFHGGMDNQQTMPFGSVEDVRREVLENVEIFRPARWICAPCHNLQAVSPTANIVAMYETIHAHGRLE